MIPQEPGTAARGCGWHLVRHSPTVLSLQHPSTLSSPSNSSFHSPPYMPCTVQHIALTEVTLTELDMGSGQIWPKKKRKMLGCEESPACKALGPAPSVPLELPSQGKEATREGSMEEKLKFPVGGSWALLPEQLQQGEPMEPLHRALHTVHMASAGSSGSRTQRTEGKGMCMKHKTSGNIGKN